MVHCLVALTNAKIKPQASEINMSDIRHLIESMDKISEAGPIKKPGQVMGYEMGGSSGTAGGGRVPNVGAIGAGIAKAKPVPKPPASAKPTTTGTTTPQSLPAGVTPSTAGAGRSGQGGPTAAELAAILFNKFN